MSYSYIFFVTLSKMSIPIYLKCYPNSIFSYRPNYIKVAILDGVLFLEGVIVALQKLLGPKFFLTKKYKQPKYDYFRKRNEINESDLEQECVICLENIGKISENLGDEYEIESQNATAYYFEVDNKAIVEVYYLDENDEWTLQETIENKGSEPGKFTAYKNFSTNIGIKLIFRGDTVYSYRNVALYTLNYNIDNGNKKYIPDYKPYYIYDLETLLPDFYKIDKLYFENYSHELINRTDYILEDGYTLVIDDKLVGNFIMKYQSYPTKIDDETDDDDEIDLPEEVACILPLYIASQLYKDDDIALATAYRNEFEVAVENLYPRKDDTKFISKTGWI